MILKNKYEYSFIFIINSGRGYSVDNIMKLRRSRTLQDSWSNFLLQISGLSEERVKCIVQAYPTLGRLLRRYKQLPNETAREQLLQDLKITPTATRRLGPSISSRVYRLL